MAKVKTGELKKVSPEKPSEIGPDKFYPTIHLSSKDLPEIAGWEVGETYKLGLEVKQITKSETEQGGIEGRFEIRKVASNPAKSEKQATAARIALAARRGKIPRSKLKGASLQMYKGMSLKELKEFSHK